MTVTPIRHVVWDWNGTLFNDGAVIVRATNDVFAPYGVSLSEEQHRALFRRPLVEFYSEALGWRVSDAEFHQLDQAFYTAYRQRISECALAADADDVMRQWAAAGNSQSLLSLWTHDDLVELVTGLGLTERFLRVEGRRGPNVGGKATLLVQHLAALQLTQDSVVLIGDSVDDATAARTVGASCVLYASGTQPLSALTATGFPVVESLTAAIAHLTR